MKKIFGRAESIKDFPTHYCSGCGHGIIHRLIGEVIDKLGIREKTIGIAPVGCAVLAYDYFNLDMIEVAHGRGPAVATGIKRVRPECIVFTYQGDGDLAAIGTAEIVHAANRGERLTVIFVNNAVYGMTGGQMAPTTLLHQKTTTTTRGREAGKEGYPLKVVEMLSLLPGVTYAERVALTSPQRTLRVKKAIEKAFRIQMEDRGFSIVEILSPCPTGWRMSPVEAIKWMEEEMISQFPLRVFKGQLGKE